MKKEYLEPCVKVYEVNVIDGIMLQTSGIPVSPDDEGDAASRMDFEDGAGSSSKSTDLWNEGW